MEQSTPATLALSQTNTTDQPVNDMEANVYAYAIAFGYVYIQTAICSVGFMLNLINYSIFVRRTFSAPAYICMTALSLADATTLGLRIPQGYIFLPQLTKHSTDLALYVYLYNIYLETPVTNMTENISAWLTVVLAIERYVSMKHWMLAKHYFTAHNTRLMVGVICLMSVVFNLPYFCLQNVSLTRVNGTLELHSSMSGFSQSFYYAIYSWLRILLVQIVPLCFLCISNCMLFILVSQHNRRLTGSGEYKSPSIYRTSESNQQQSFRNTRCTPVEPKKNPTVNSVDTEEDKTQQSLVKHSSLSCFEQSSEKLSQRDETIDKNVVSKSVNNDRAQRRRATQNKLTILLIAVILLFLIGQVPQSLAYMRVFTTLGICTIDDVEYCIAHRIYRMVSVNLAQLAFASTFFIYSFLNRDFRTTLKSSARQCVMGRQLCHCCQRS